MQVILTHENADFDAIASLMGAHKLYPGALPVLPRRINRNVQAFLALYGAELPFVDPNMLPRGRRIHRVILVDTQSITSVRGMGQELDEVLIIDHHTPPQSLPPGWVFRGEMLGATTTMLVEVLSARLIPVSRIEATLMLSGIYEDTGALTYASTTARDLRAAAWLLDRDASLQITNEFLYHPLSPAQHAIYEMLLDNMETLQLEGHNVIIAWAQAPPGTDEEISTLAHKLRDLLKPSALFVLVDMDGHTQLVARSTSDDINVDAVARHFGGGGHARAAAALLRERPVASVLAELREVLPRFVHPRLTVRDLMSHSIRTVTPETPIQDVSNRMLHTGHEGFPVVDDQGRIVGLVTRNAVDRALQHQWGQQPVRRIMEPGEVAVAPEDSAERVRSLMIRTGWGQIPVVKEGRLTGVVTRTDLIHLPPSERETKRLEISRRMEAAFPAPLLELIRRTGEEAAGQGSTIYFVGGLVRDLLLEHPIFDVDLVVEGDAIRLGRALTHKYGGELRTHSRFGTAKWLLAPEIWQRVTGCDRPPNQSCGRLQVGGPACLRSPDRATPDATPENLPAFIDLVTARTEFYTRPSALPTVERSSIKQDLHRRDFTINTLAIRLSPGHWGELLDFFGGQADLENGVIRVLHSLSFVDDPTRILRAARFETRLGFHLDVRSESLIADALPLFHRVTGGRIRHELELIFNEARPEDALERLQDLGALAAIDPALASGGARRAFAQMRERLDSDFWQLDADDLVRLHWALFLYRLDAPALRNIAQRLMMPRRLSNALYQLPALRQILAQLPELEKPGDVMALLEPLTSPLLAASWLVTEDSAIQEQLTRYWTEWRHVKPELTGEDLKRLGLKPGPLYR
ncbi:MAG: CBS domain-containing protein, partial [Anaerolineae bacterium]|nr:CBS domain-containing protein [Anaerolineae bacterium]